MRTLIFLFSMSFVAACALPGMFQGGGSSKSQTNQSSYSRSETTEEVNGESIEQKSYQVPANTLQGTYEVRGGFLSRSNGTGRPGILASSGSSALDCIDIF